MNGSNDTRQRQGGFVNLPNDVSRCAGMIDRAHPHPGFCPYRNKCERHLQLARDEANGITHYRGMSVISNCLVNGEYTMRIEANV